MAHYAYLNDNNVVYDVIVGPDEGTEPEGISSWENYFTAKGKGRCLRTSYNGNIRGKYAGIGDTYDEANDVFVAPIEEAPEDGA